MSDLIARAFAEKAQIDAEVAENHAREKAEAAKEMLAATREALAYLFGVTPSEMVDESGDWSTVRVGDLRFAGHFNGAASWVRLVLPCPDCGELKSTDRITSLYDLAEVDVGRARLFRPCGNARARARALLRRAAAGRAHSRDRQRRD
jgi:hypothetical protein